MSENVSFSKVISDAAQLAHASWRAVTAVLLVIVVMTTTTDLLLTGADLARLQAFLGLITLYLQLLVTGVALSHANLPGYAYDPKSPTKGRYPGAFLQSIIYILGFVVGLVLLILPGFVLMVRWMVCVPALLAEDLTATDSLRRSWNLTRTNWKLATAVLGLALASWIFPFVALVALYPDEAPPNVWAALLVNILFGVAGILGWLLDVALYAGLRRR